MAPPARPFLLAAIARPERLETDVKNTGAVVAGRAFFRDHHAFRPGELLDVVAAARAAGADAVVTTEKDAVRLAPVLAGRLPAREEELLTLPVLVFRIAAEIEGEGRFRERLLRAARRAA